MAKKLLPPYLIWREGRPRWEPGPKLRALGHKGRDLKDDAGVWLGMVKSIEAARAINASIGEGLDPAAVTARTRLTTGRTPATLWERWQTAPKFQALGAKTKRDYAIKIAIFLAEFGDAPLAAISKPQLHGFWEELFHDRGHHMANGVLAAVSSMFSYAELAGWRAPNTNPALRMGRMLPAPRLVIWYPNEINHLIATAEAMGVPSIADAAIIALHIGQRQADVLALPPRLAADGRIKLTQMKTTALIDCPMTDQLAQRITQIRARWKADGVAGREALVIRESDQAPYTGDAFRTLFRAVRERAAETMPEIADKRFQDFRDTAVTRLALAGCNMAEIGAITGHSLKTITQILKHYLVTQPEMADAAISKLQAWMSKQGIAV